MRIAFICGSLEAGRDGVGDYSRALAEECTRQGHKCILIALNDRNIHDLTIQQAEEYVPEYRYPAILPWNERVQLALQVIESFQADWISLQLVAYSFHDKGILWRFAQKVKPLIRNRRLHVMFHEVWISIFEKSSLRKKLVGSIQRYCLELIRDLSPHAIHTTNAAYARVLQLHGIHAEIIPLFGNIPFAPAGNAEWFWRLLNECGIKIENNREYFWLIGFFGSIYPEWRPEPLFRLLESAGSQAKKKVVVLSVGKIGEPGERMWEQLQRRYAPSFHFVRLGFQPVERISQYFQCLDFGLATAPLILCDKSGSVIAMKEHGLPVLVNQDSIRINGVSIDDLDEDDLAHVDDCLEAKLLAGIAHKPPKSFLSCTCKEFISTLLFKA